MENEKLYVDVEAGGIDPEDKQDTPQDFGEAVFQQQMSDLSLSALKQKRRNQAAVTHVLQPHTSPKKNGGVPIAIKKPKKPEHAHPVGPFGIIHLQLLPDAHTEQQRSEVNDLFMCLLALCSVEERAGAHGTVSHLTMLHGYYNATREQRDNIDAEIERQGIDHGVENMLRVAYRNTKQKGPMPIVDEEAPLAEQQQQDEEVVKHVVEGGTPAYEDICGFLSYHFTQQQVYVGHVFVTEKYRRQRVGGTMLRNLVASFFSTETLSPLLVADVPASDSAVLRLFMGSGFFFARQPLAPPVKGDDETEAAAGLTSDGGYITREQAMEMDGILRKHYCSPEATEEADRRVMQLIGQLPHYEFMLHPVTKTYRVVNVLACCHTCKSVSVAREHLQRCACCHTALYCSTECQKKHWKQHKQCCTVKRI